MDKRPIHPPQRHQGHNHQRNNFLRKTRARGIPFLNRYSSSPLTALAWTRAIMGNFVLPQRFFSVKFFIESPIVGDSK
jgi:hypothetical protein